MKRQHEQWREERSKEAYKLNNEKQKRGQERLSMAQGKQAEDENWSIEYTKKNYQNTMDLIRDAKNEEELTRRHESEVKLDEKLIETKTEAVK